MKMLHRAVAITRAQKLAIFFAARPLLHPPARLLGGAGSGGGRAGGAGGVAAGLAYARVLWAWAEKCGLQVGWPLD